MIQSDDTQQEIEYHCVDCGWQTVTPQDGEMPACDSCGERIKYGAHR